MSKSNQRHVLIFFIWLSLFSGSAIYLFHETPVQNRCGVVWDTKVADAIQAHRNNATITTENYFVVKWDSGGYEKIDVSVDTFYKNPKGSRVCFAVPKEVSFMEGILAIFFVFSCLSIAIAIIYGIVTYLDDVLNS